VVSVGGSRLRAEPISPLPALSGQRTGADGECVPWPGHGTNAAGDPREGPDTLCAAPPVSSSTSPKMTCVPLSCAENQRFERSIECVACDPGTFSQGGMATCEPRMCGVDQFVDANFECAACPPTQHPAVTVSDHRAQ
jgi:hypothetical protein